MCAPCTMYSAFATKHSVMRTTEFRADVEHLPCISQQQQKRRKKTNSRVEKPFHLMVYCCFHVLLFALRFLLLFLLLVLLLLFNRVRHSECSAFNADIYAYVLNYIGQMNLLLRMAKNAWQNNVLVLLFLRNHTESQPAWNTHINQNNISFSIWLLLASCMPMLNAQCSCPYLLFYFELVAVFPYTWNIPFGRLFSFVLFIQCQ